MKRIDQAIETTRLSLKALSPADSAFILALLNSPGWLAFIGDRQVINLHDAETYIHKIIQHTNTSYWVVRLKTEDRPLGIVTLIQRDYLEHPDIGFAFLPEHTKHGYAYEAAGAVLQEIIRAGSYPEILATTVKENQHSIRLLEKLGLRFKQEIVHHNDTLLLYAITADAFLIDQLTHRFFDLFSNANGREPALDGISELCIPEALLIKKAGLREEIYTLETFIAPRKKILSDGTLTEFTEKEISEHTTVNATMAQRSSAYRKQGILNHKSFEQQGHKFIQFMKTLEGWKISSVLWQDEER